MNILSLEEQIKLIKDDVWNIKKIDNPYDETYLEASKEVSLFFRNIKEQTEEMCLNAIKDNPRILEYVKEQTPEMYIEAIERWAWTLEFVKEQTDELCLMAVKRIGGTLKHVKKQTPEICLEAVKNWGLALEFVKEQTPEICLAAVKQNGNALKYVKDKTEDICLEAIKSEKEAIVFIPMDKISEKLYLELKSDKKYSNYTKSKEELIEDLTLIVIRKYSKEIVEYIPKNNFTEKVCFEVLKKGVKLIEYIPKDKLTKELYLKFVNKYKTLIKEIPKDVLTDNMCMYAFLNNYNLIKDANIKDKIEKLKNNNIEFKNKVFYLNISENKLKDIFNDKKYEFIQLDIKSLDYLNNLLIDKNTGNHFVLDDKTDIEVLKRITLSDNELVIVNKGNTTKLHEKIANKVINL